jgi:hypothetical protein
VIWAVRRLEPLECEGVSKFVSWLSIDRSNELTQRQLDLRMNGKYLLKLREVCHVDCVIVRQAVSLDPEEKALDDSGGSSTDPRALE